MRNIMDKKGQMSIGDGPTVVLIIGLIFLIMATVAFVSEKYGAAMTDGSIAQNVTTDLQTEISNNTSIAGIVLTISLIGMVLSVLIGVFLVVRGRRL